MNPMSLSGFEEWQTYDKKYSDMELSAFFPSQGDLVQTTRKSGSCFLICITNCCDIDNEKYERLSFIEAVTIYRFLRDRYIKDKIKDSNAKIKSGENFSTETIEQIKNSANKKAIDEYYSANNKRAELKSIFENRPEEFRYIFIPHYKEYFNKDLIVDLQRMTSFVLINKDNPASINERIIEKKDKIKVIHAKLNYLFRDYILQRLGAYISRVSLPSFKKLDKNYDQGFWFQVFDRAINDVA
ncbi:hypothetical protein A2246_04355 [candidate division WOR-1 bacterium RIFOXYA2_FULL_37_7]|nr:MAG: hypothetical protein A2246_04355 [candidate division WOR-1 bacterium RIFOXYA2_FULL_37_7]